MISVADRGRVCVLFAAAHVTFCFSSEGKPRCVDEHKLRIEHMPFKTTVLALKTCFKENVIIWQSKSIYIHLDYEIICSVNLNVSFPHKDTPNILRILSTCSF